MPFLSDDELSWTLLKGSFQSLYIGSSIIFRTDLKGNHD